jgi:hypothetical protein
MARLQDKNWARLLLGASCFMLFAAMAAPWGSVPMGTTGAKMDFFVWGMTAYGEGLPESRGWFHDDLKSGVELGLGKLQFGLILFLGGFGLVLLAFVTSLRRRMPDHDVAFAAAAGILAIIVTGILYVVGVKQAFAGDGVGFFPAWSWGFYLTGAGAFSLLLALGILVRPEVATASEPQGNKEAPRAPI